MNRILLCVFFVLTAISAQSQNWGRLYSDLSSLHEKAKISIQAELDIEKNTLEIQQQILYHNFSNDTLKYIYLNDWANAFSAKNTPLAERFAENYRRRFHFAKDWERGYTQVDYISHKGEKLSWMRPENHPDIIHLELEKPLLPFESRTFDLSYRIKIPSADFTRWGYETTSSRPPVKNYKLRYWNLVPAVYKNGEWQIYSHKNLGDLFVPPMEVSVSMNLPANYSLISTLHEINTEYISTRKIIHLQGKNQTLMPLYLTVAPTYPFETIHTPSVEVLTNLKDAGLSEKRKNDIISRIINFLETRLGEYPFDKMLITREDYLASPVYGLNQLPNFIRPFPDGFQYDIKQMKTITHVFLEKSLQLNPRKEKWLADAIQISLMMDYVDTFYPDMKLLGSLSDWFIIKWFHLADLGFNEQYSFLYMNMPRLNLDQPLSMSRDSLIKYNENIGSPYKAGVGFKYLEDFLEDESVRKSIKEFYETYRLEPAGEEEFKSILKKNSSKEVSWFFEDYVHTNKKIDFTIKKVETRGDSLRVSIKNKSKSGLPVSLYGLNDGKVVSKTWVENIRDLKTVTIAADSVERVALNYEGIIPEINQRNNHKRVTTFLNKPFQPRLLLDVEDPHYSQVYIIPEFSYNLYDGVAIGPKLHNKAILNKDFEYSLSPKFGFTSGSIVGSAAILNTHTFNNQRLSAIGYGFGGTRFSYADDLYYYKFTPSIFINWRDPYLRNNAFQTVSLRSVSVIREGNTKESQDEPDYNVLNARYVFSDKNMTDYFTTYVDAQYSDKFSKVAVSAKYRKLFNTTNRQINLRFFAGAFLHNDTREIDYFSFALDRPSDYLFDYNYYGRSETSGLFSQQFIEAEGGFKSQLEPAFANEWITTFNSSVSLWPTWVYAYGDVGLVKNKGFSPEFVYDSGVSVSLVQDYFEVFFPIYSNLGWEIAQPDYDQKIRFIVTIDINTLIKLFTREWY